MAMEVGCSSGAKPDDFASSSRGDWAINGFHRSDSVPRLEDLIAGDSRLEELFEGDTNGEDRNESSSEDDEDSPSASASAETSSSLCERGHALTFLVVAPYSAGAFMCNRCSQQETGEVYHCATCLFDLCPSCARSAPAPTPSIAATPFTQEIPPTWGQPLLSCTHLASTLTLMESAPYESGAYMCNLCLKTGDGAVYHCTVCTDFDLHPECARIAREIVSFTHPHRLLLQPPYSRGYNAICDGCLEVLGGSQWVYRCSNSNCDFDIHARCAKYARTISHPIHEEHDLVLINDSSTTGPNSSVVCDSCEAQVDPKELVYHCEECGFDIHPNCAIGELVRS